VTDGERRGTASSGIWQARCKDCEAERRAASGSSRRGTPGKKSQDGPDSHFSYAGNWAERLVERGSTRSDRCERHRKAHRQAIQAIAVPYVSVAVIGEVADPEQPTGPLGAVVGPLPLIHKEKVVEVDLDRFEFGMSDADVLRLLDGLRDRRVAVVEAGTGTGKSTFMPFRLMRPPKGGALDLTRHGPIVVTEPRRAAAKGVARFVGEELCLGHDSSKCGAHIGPGFSVGYQVSGERSWDGACQLLYVTDGTMINWVRDGRVAQFGAIVIDEAHERSENIDIILTQLREKLVQYPHLRVIITSATLDKDFFVEYFGGPDRVFHMAVPATKNFGYGVPLFVGLQVDEDLIAYGLTIEDGSGAKVVFEGWNPVGPELAGFPREDLRSTTRAVARLRTDQRLPVEAWKREMPLSLADQVVAIAAGTDWGDILGFLPTTAVIEQAIARIERELARQGLRKAFDVYPLLATTERGISDKATAARSRGEKRKIVVSSNLAETSLTVKGVRFVVDSGLICQPEWDPELASGSYPTRAHSRSGVRQRWGRVGRDAPGWVFPLYTVDQFFEMGANTPPGSAQTNLETFWMKLMAAGVEQDAAVPPVSFRHESVVPDEAGLRVRETFERESTRARAALRATGATDKDGHLTEYGRDLERFPGTGSEALALMLAEQLACVHEVALALHVLGPGILFGRRDDCILQVNTSWPAAWRVGALQRHAGLAVGCADDLDLLLRVVSLWQGAGNRSELCAQWWINESAIGEAWRAAMETVETLSAAMKGEAYRPVEVTLADRVRGILTHTMVSARYVRRVDGFEAASVSADKPELVQLSRAQLMEVGDEILAFHRFRVGDGTQDRTRAFVSHVVRRAPWASDAAKSDEAGLDLLIRASARQRREDTEDVRIQAVQLAYPIGCAVDLVLGPERAGTRPIQDIDVVDQPFPRPRLKGSDDEEDVGSENGSGAHRDWDPVGRDTTASVPEEEVEARVLDPRAEEASDDSLAPSPTSGRAAERASGPEVGELGVIAESPLMDLAPAMRGTVIGYRSEKRGMTLVIQPLGEGTAADPAQHPDLALGDTARVVVIGECRDQEQPAVQLMRADGRGHFYVKATGLNSYDRDCLLRVKPGTLLTATVVPDGPHGVSATVLPDLLERATTGAESLTVDGKTRTFFPASVIEAQNERGWVTVALGARDAAATSPRLGVRGQHMRGLRIPTSDVGQGLLVALDAVEQRRSRVRVGEGAQASVEAIARRYPGEVELDGGILGLVGADVPLGAMQELSAALTSPAQREGLWAAYVESLTRVVVDVRPQTVRVTVPCSPALASLIAVRLRDVQPLLDVGIRKGEAPNQIVVSSQDQGKAELGASRIGMWEEMPRIWATIPSGTAGRVLGKEHTNRRRWEETDEIEWVWVDGTTVGVVGRSQEAVKRVFVEIRALAESARGELTISPTRNGLLIGRGGATINRLKEATGCHARESGGTWTIDGPNEAAVREFIRMATAIVSGQARIVNVASVIVRDDTTAVRIAGRSGQAVKRSDVRASNARGGAGTSVPAANGRPCFVATACFDDADHPDVAVLREWRDEVLSESVLGRRFIRVYYRMSPRLAEFVADQPLVAAVGRRVVSAVARYICRGIGGHRK